MKRNALLLAALFVAGSIGPLPAQTTNAATATNAPTAIPPASVAITQADIISKAQAVLAKYPEPSATTAPDPVEIDVRQQMADFDPQFFLDAVGQVLAHNPTLDHIRTLINLGTEYLKSTKNWDSSLTTLTNNLDAKDASLAAAITKWKETKAALKAANPPAAPEYGQQVDAVLARLDAVRRDESARKSSLPKLQLQVAAQETVISNALDQLGAARDRAFSRLLEANAPPVWSARPMPPDDSGMLGWSKQVQSLAAYIQAEPGKFLIHGLLLVLLAGGFLWLRGYARKLAQKEPGIAPAARIFETPLTMALLLSLTASPLLYYPITPRLLSALLGAIALAPCVILLRRLIEPRLFPILYALVVFYFIEEFRSVATMPPASARALLLVEILGAVAFLGWLLLSLDRTGTTGRFSHDVQLGARAAFAALSAGWLAEVLGFTLLANLICVAVQSSATLALALYAGIRVIEALLFIMIRLRPLSDLGMVRLHGPLLLRRAQRVLAWVAAIAWVVALLQRFPLWSDVANHIDAFFGTHDEHNHLVLTVPGRLLAAIIIGWTVYQLSRFGRFALETDFYPRLHLSPGIPYAISTSLHYAMLVIAFVGATYTLGIDMTQFTILVSALGVGVGFGLQNIINNFVSGLILLFERPVKLGDSVQVGDATGTVERIGIRASVLRSSNGSELIVPNASLISNNVINWTLSSRERIILIPLTVVCRPEIGHLIELLTTTAAAHPKVLKQPSPQVLAQALGANLSLELRAWTRSVDEWGLVRSELVLAIGEVLARENVTLA